MVVKFTVQQIRKCSVFVMFLGGLAVGQVLHAMAQDPPQGNRSGSVWFDSIGQLILFLTTVAGFAAQIIREQLARKAEERKAERLRIWQVEDREDARITAEALAVKTEETARRIEKSIVEQSNAIRSDVADNTELSKSAFREANDINRKIAAITQRFAEEGTIPGTLMETVDEIDKTTKDTQQKVADITEVLVEHHQPQNTQREP